MTQQGRNLLMFVQLRHDITDIVPWMAVETLFQSLLVQKVSNESHAKNGLSSCTFGRAHLSVNFYLRPRTKTALRAPISINSCDSSFVKQPHCRIKSTKQTAIQPSTFKIRFGFWIENYQLSTLLGFAAYDF